MQTIYARTKGSRESRRPAGDCIYRSFEMREHIRGEYLDLSHPFGVSRHHELQGQGVDADPLILFHGDGELLWVSGELAWMLIDRMLGHFHRSTCA